MFERFFLPAILGFMALVFCAIAVGCWFLRDEELANLAKVRDIPEKSLEEACRNDGAAWVSVRLDRAASQPLYCNGLPCLWKARETVTRTKKSVYRNGKWENQTETKVTRSNIETVPLRLTGASATMTIEQWRGFKLSNDLLRGRGETAPERDEKSAPAPNQTDLYVPEGIAAWVMARFERGKPKPVFGDEWVLCFGGREALVAEMGESTHILFFLAMIFGGFGALFGVGAVLTLLPKRASSETLPGGVQS